MESVLAITGSAFVLTLALGWIVIFSLHCFPSIAKSSVVNWLFEKVPCPRWVETVMNIVVPPMPMPSIAKPKPLVLSKSDSSLKKQPKQAKETPEPDNRLVEL